jgi:hypothetical protein
MNKSRDFKLGIYLVLSLASVGVEVRPAVRPDVLLSDIGMPDKDRCDHTFVGNTD